MYGWDAAEQMMRIMTRAVETVLKLAGSFVKNLAAILIAVRIGEQKRIRPGKTSRQKLLRTGADMQFLTLSRNQYREFQRSAKHEIAYAVIAKESSDGERVCIMFPARQAAMTNYILESIGFGKAVPEGTKLNPAPAQLEPQKKTQRDPNRKEQQTGHEQQNAELDLKQPDPAGREPERETHYAEPSRFEKETGHIQEQKSSPERKAGGQDLEQVVREIKKRYRGYER